MNIDKIISESIETKQNLDSQKIETIGNKIIDIYNNGGKLLIAGNGGSASDSQHFSAELLARYSKERRPLPAIALHCDTSSLTAWSNDYDYNSFYSRMIDGLGNENDLFFAISTSGNSENLINALNKAKDKGIYSYALLGKDGGKMKAVADNYYVVPSNNTARVQECHIMMIHIICEMLDNTFD